MIGLLLTCGCCGADFRTWDGYEDQGQDIGYGICASCQEWIGEKTDNEMDKAIALIAGALSETNRENFLKKSRKAQEIMVFNCLERGYLTWQIGR